MSNHAGLPVRWRAWIGLGANLGEPLKTLIAALESLSNLAGTTLVKVSAPYLTKPLDADGPDYWNAVAELQTSLAPQALLAAMQAIENQHGRLRLYRNAPRTLDLDLLWHEQGPLQEPQLTLPHPRMKQRAFVLAPWSELEPDLPLPGGGTPATWLASLPDQGIARQTRPQGWPLAC